MTETQPTTPTEVPENLPENVISGGEYPLDEGAGRLPDHMPDVRTAQRLLALVDQLEKQRADLITPSAPVVTAPDPALISENRALKSLQKQALARLDVLLERLESQQKLPAGPDLLSPPAVLEDVHSDGEEAP